MNKKHQRGCRPQRYTVEQVAEALRLSAGILSAAGEKLGCSGQCVANYLSRYPKLAEVAREAQEATLDLAESGLVSLIRERHPTSILFYLRTKGRHRGYNTTMQVATADQKFFPIGRGTHDAHRSGARCCGGLQTHSQAARKFDRAPILMARFKEEMKRNQEQIAAALCKSS